MRQLFALNSFRDVVANRDLRRVELAWAGASVAAWSYGIGLVVFAFERDGAYAVGLIGLIRWLLAAAAAPATGLLGDRYPRAWVMLGANVARAATMAAMALVALSDAPSLIVYALAVLVTVASTAFRPAQAALLPSLARSPRELTAANVVSSTIESVGVFVGPALGGLLLAATDVATVFFATAALYLLSSLFVAPLARRREQQAARRTRGAFSAEIAAGIRTISGEPRLRLLIGLFAAQTFVDGALGVLVVVLALDALDLGASGVGFLNAATGVGGLVGGVAAAALVGRRRLAGGFGLGIVLWGAPLVVIALRPSVLAALVLLGLVGLGNTLVDVAGDTLLQRSVDDEVLARVFSVFRSLMLVTTALGAIAAPLLIDALDTRGAFVVTGMLLPVLAALSWRRLAAIDADARAPTDALELLRAIPIFAPLAPPTLERLAAELEPQRVPAGATIFREGERGDRFYVIADGAVEIHVDTKAPPRLARGDFFGEIALLRDVPRTATVVASTDTELYALRRDEFLGAVTGHPDSAEAARAVVRARLETPRGGVALA